MAAKKPAKKPAKKRATPEREKKRRAVAKGVVAGKSTRKIAKDLGVSQRTVQAIAAEEETQFLIRRIMKPHEDRITAMIPRVLDVIDEAMLAEKTDAADHKIRLMATERHSELMELMQGKVKEKESAEGPQLISAELFFSLTTVDAKEN